MKDRRLYVGGSDVPVIFGLCSYKTPYDLYLEKIADEPKDEDNELLYWGRTLEPVIRQDFEKRNGLKVLHSENFVRHKVYDFIGGHLDGYIAEENAVLEIKCANVFVAQKWGAENTDHIPMNYLFQVAYYCFLTNADFAYIAVLIGGNQYRQYKYVRDKHLEENIINKVFEFWHCVQTRTPPPFTTINDLKKRYEESEDETCMIRDDIESSIEALKAIKEQRRALDSNEEQHKMRIMEAMGPCSTLVDKERNVVCTWKTTKKGHRVFKLKEEM